MTAQEVFNPARCPLCGLANDCLMCSPVAYKGPCWCMHEDIPRELLARVPENLRNRACICRACVEAFRREKLLSIVHPVRAAHRGPV
jgi:hypothetical protein